MSFTPGPWEVGKSGICYGGYVPQESMIVFGAEHYKQEGVRGNGAVICYVAPPEFTTDIDLANARLIAAAPELLEACNAMLAAFEYSGSRLIGAEFHAKEQIVKAVAKAVQS